MAAIFFVSMIPPVFPASGCTMSAALAPPKSGHVHPSRSQNEGLWNGEDGELTPSLGQCEWVQRRQVKARQAPGEHLHLPRLGCGPRSSSTVEHIDAFSTAGELRMVQASIPCLVISRSALSFQTSICTIFPPR